MQRYAWPGNVRELRNVMERAVLLATNGVVHAADLPLGGSAPGGRAAEPMVPLDDVERAHIESVLVHVNWHQGKAAEILGISPKTLYRKIREYGFHRPAAG
jgi:DNA-binding NtrC family response regulator